MLLVFELCRVPTCLKCSRLLTGVVKNGSFKGLRDLKKKSFRWQTAVFLFFPGTNVFNGIFFWRRQFFVGGVLNLKGCVFVYVPHVSGHKFSVKGALGVGGGGEE
jgi:hypothetical protein